MSSPRSRSEAWMLPADHRLRRFQGTALVVGGVGAGLSVLGAILDHDQFFRSYLIAWMFWLGVAIGSLALLMIHHIAGGAWGGSTRRIMEAAGRTMPLLALLFLPILLGLPAVYEWARPEAVAHDAILQQKAPYLNVPFFVVRAVLYFGAWCAVAHLLHRWSLAEDASGDPSWAKRQEYLSRGGLVLFGLTVSFASFDWGMSIEPHWFSTIYGFLVISGQVLSATALLIVVANATADRKPIDQVIDADKFHDLGKLLLAFTMVWAYLTISQFLIIWSANLPEEIPWYIRRTSGGWQVLVVAIAFFHFILPFVVLLSRDVKRKAHRLAVLAGYMFVVRYLEVFWLLRPGMQPEGPHAAAAAVHWLDLTTLVGVGGLWAWFFLGRFFENPILPLNDLALGDPGEAAAQSAARAAHHGGHHVGAAEHA